jgi:hypothetical protein
MCTQSNGVTEQLRMVSCNQLHMLLPEPICGMMFMPDMLYKTAKLALEITCTC